MIAGGELLPEGVEDFVGGYFAGFGEMTADGVKAAAAVVNLIVKGVVQIENNCCYHRVTEN